MKRIRKKHSIAARWTHWVNFPLLTIMIWSGVLIYWAFPAYRIGWGNTTVLQLFPKSFFEALHIPQKLAEGMSFHFVFMWAFFANGVVYVLYTIFSGEWRELVPVKGSFRRSFQVVLHDLRLRKAPVPQVGKYNDAQRIAYTAIIVMGFGSILTGLAIYKPAQFSAICALCGGYEAARAIHFILTIGYCLFFIIHLVQVIIAGWGNFRSMITGFEVVKETPEQPVVITKKEAE